MSAQFQFCVAQSNANAETWVEAASLGVENIIRTRLHAGVDTLQITLSGQTALTDNALWSYNTIVRLRRIDGSTPTLLFMGRVQPFARSASGQSEAVSVEVRGIWDWFEKTVMRQLWQESGSTYVYAPRVVLFGGRATGAQMIQAIECAIAAGCPVQIGSILTGYTPPRDEQINVTVADVIVKCLANHPHAVLWIDYSTRVPTVRVATRQSLTAFTVALSAGQAESLSIMSREDLQPPALAIAYIRTMTDGDRSWVATTIDKAPANATVEQLYSVDAVWGTFELQGATTQYIEQKVKTESIDWDDNKDDPEWWRARCPGIADADIESIDNPSGQFSWPNFLTEGSLAEWMNVRWDSELFTADATLTRSNASGVAEKRIEKISFTATTTNASTKTYKKQTSYDSGEVPPTGLAAQMFAEWCQLHHDGEIVITDAEAPMGAGPGMTLNITGGRSEWVSMAAMIISVSEDYASGSLKITFGVPGWIDLDSRMAWIKNCRTRRYGWAVEDQQNTSEDDNSGGQAFPSVKDGNQPTVWIRQRFIQPGASPAHEIDINLGDISGTTARSLKVREIKVLVQDGESYAAQSVLAICTEPYGETEPVGGGHFDLRYNSTSHCLEKQTEDGGSWSTITGGQAVQETV